MNLSLVQRVNANIIAKAKSHLGESEILDVNGNGINSGPEVDKYLAFVGLGPGYAWCAAFASYVLHWTLLQAGALPVESVLSTASSHVAVNYGLAHNTHQTAQTAIPGDWLIERGGDGEQAKDGFSYHHTTMLVSINSSGICKWIAGNTGDKVAYGSCRISDCFILRPYVI